MESTAVCWSTCEAPGQLGTDTGSSTGAVTLAQQPAQTPAPPQQWHHTQAGSAGRVRRPLWPHRIVKVKPRSVFTATLLSQVLICAGLAPHVKIAGGGGAGGAQAPAACLLEPGARGGAGVPHMPATRVISA